MAARPLSAPDLSGYVNAQGAISVLYDGNSSDPYFAMQALLLAHENGMDTAAPVEQFVNWLLPKQKPDGTFDRFCRSASKAWAPCKVADADDSLLAIWMKLLETMPAQLSSNAAWKKSYAISKASLEHLYQPSRGIYMVSPVYLHGLFMDNLEVWSLKANTSISRKTGESEQLARAIHSTFWNPIDQRFLVSTQLEQRSQKAAFYPDHVAQVFPLLVGFPLLPQEANLHYRQWMDAHRSEWLNQSQTDYPWGLLAVLALRQNDRASARCWMREAMPLRHGARWAVTDEVSLQILLAAKLLPASEKTPCA